ncbi:MAG: hypothetical protein C1O27_000550 [Chloroflexi bacterium]|jgi:hypothetical protein|nr:MAG: hypothetical protein C1O27_000550 [Chloroflexota bacterium]
MARRESSICFAFEGATYQVFKVVEVLRDRNPQVVIAFAQSDDEHVSLHQQDHTILKTHYDAHKPSSGWYQSRIEAALSMGLRNPSRHGSYTHQIPLLSIANVKGHYLLGKRIELKSLVVTKRKKCQTLSAPSQSFWVDLFLSTQGNYHDGGAFRIATFLGEVSGDVAIDGPITSA